MRWSRITIAVAAVAIGAGLFGAIVNGTTTALVFASLCFAGLVATQTGMLR